jgi:hypothetical protein
MQQQPITDPDTCVPIPTSIVQQMLQFGHRHYRALAWQPDTLVHIKTFREILALCTIYCYYAAQKMGYAATWTTSRSTELAVTYCLSYEWQREINGGQQPTSRYYNSLLMHYRY